MIDRDEHAIAGEGGLGALHEPGIRPGQRDQDARPEQEDRGQHPDERPARSVDEGDEHPEGPGGRGLAPENRVERHADQDGGDQPQGAVDAADDAEHPRHVGVPRSPEPDRGHEPDDRREDDGPRGQPADPPAIAHAEIRPAGAIRGHACRSPEQREAVGEPR